MPCRPCAATRAQARAQQGSPASPAQGVASPVPVPSMYEVMTQRGNSTGRKFTSRLAAEGFASRIGGTVRAVNA